MTNPLPSSNTDSVTSTSIPATPQTPALSPVSQPVNSNGKSKKIMLIAGVIVGLVVVLVLIIAGALLAKSLLFGKDEYFPNPTLVPSTSPETMVEDEMSGWKMFTTTDGK